MAEPSAVRVAGAAPAAGVGVGWPAGVPAARRWRGIDGVVNGAPRPARRPWVPAGDGAGAAELSAGTAAVVFEPLGEIADGAVGGSPWAVTAAAGAPGAGPDGCPCELSAVRPDGLSDQRLRRTGTVPCGGGSGAGVPAPGACPEAPEPAAPESAADRGVSAPARGGDADGRRWATTAEGEGAWVSGTGAGRTVAAGGTVARVRTGAVAGSMAGWGHGASPETSVGGAARRWTGIGARDVRLGTAAGRASTSPGGAVGPTSWPSGWSTGGRGWWPGTASRKGSDGATSGADPVARSIGGNEAQAPVAGAPDAAGVADSDGPSAGPAGMSGEGPSDGVLRPNGQGRRTGLTPPRTGAC
jgi:hypothetical protein